MKQQRVCTMNCGPAIGDTRTREEMMRHCEDCDTIAAAGMDGEEKKVWIAMLYAPTDGTEVELLLHHPNRRFEAGEARKQWEQIVRAKWIDFNGGGWTWRGMFGQPMGWRPIPAASVSDGDAIDQPGTGLDECVSNHGPAGCYRVRCQLGKKCIADKGKAK